MLVSRIDQLLALTDPFDLAQAAERHVSSLSGKRIRALLRDAGPRLGDYYRTEIARLSGAASFEEALASRYPETALRTGLAEFLKSNLRAIPIFGGAFGLAVLDRAPLDRAVGIGEERSSPAGRAAVVAGAALALIVAGAAGERVVAGARAAVTPPPLPLAVATLVPQNVHSAKPAPKRVIARAETPRPTAAPQQTPSAAPATAAPPAPAPVVAAPATPRPTASPPPPKGAGSAVVEVTAAPATPSPEPTDLDTSDMPEAYSDATPMPQQSLTPADVPQHAIRVPTPKPSPKPHGWLHRTVMHLNPFKPHIP